METRPRLRVSYGRLEEPGIKLRTPGYKAKRDDYIHGYLHLIVEYGLSPLTIMGRTTRVENRGETTRGERTRGKHLGGETSCYRFGLDPQSTNQPQSLNCFWGPACSWQKNVSVSLISKHTFTYIMFKCFVAGKKILVSYFKPPLTQSAKK